VVIASDVAMGCRPQGNAPGDILSGTLDEKLLKKQLRSMH